MGPHRDSSLAHRDQSAQGKNRPETPRTPRGVRLRVLTTALTGLCGLGWLATSYLDARALGESRSRLSNTVLIALGWLNSWLVGIICAVAALGWTRGDDSQAGWALLAAFIGATITCVVSAQLQAPRHARRVAVTQLQWSEIAAALAQLAIVAMAWHLATPALVLLAPLGRAALMVRLDRARQEVVGPRLHAPHTASARIGIASSVSIVSLSVLATLLIPSPAREASAEPAPQCVEVRDATLQVSTLPRGVHVRTADGGGAGDVLLPGEEALADVRTLRCPTHSEVAMTAKSGRVYVVRFNEDGVRLDDGFIERAAFTRFHSLVFMELLAMLALLGLLLRSRITGKDVP